MEIRKMAELYALYPEAQKGIVYDSPELLLMKRIGERDTDGAMADFDWVILNGSDPDLFEEYTTSCELVNVKTTNMGSMFRLTYDVTLKDPDREKEMIDRLRCRNGNLEINVSRQGMTPTEL